MNKLIAILFFIFITIFLGACSSSKDTTDKNNNDKEGVYVFDEVPASDSIQIDNAENDLNFNYFVQIGAFTTKASAEEFAAESVNTLNKELDIKYNNISNLYTVRLKELFNSRIEAEKKRNELWQDDKFKDAWIVKEYK
jgi:cell division protein FtsN